MTSGVAYSVLLTLFQAGLILQVSDRKEGGHIFKVQWLSSFCRNMWVQMSFDANFYNRMRAVEKLQKCSSRTILADEALPLVFFCLVWHILFLCLQAMNIDCQSSSLLHYYLVK